MGRGLDRIFDVGRNPPSPTMEPSVKMGHPCEFTAGRSTHVRESGHGARLVVGYVVVADDAGELPAGWGVVPEHGELGLAGGDFRVAGVGEAVGADFEVRRRC